MIRITIPTQKIKEIIEWFTNVPWVYLVIVPSIAFAIIATGIFFSKGELVAYGDTESHLNIAKRVVTSLTPGAAQLGGIWLPVPHIMMLPFIWSDFLWRTGLAGSIVSGFCYVITTITLYKLVMLITKNRTASVVSSWIFMLNPNILYLQSTAMTELPLIAFFILSSYFFIRYIKNIQAMQSLILSAGFGFLAVLSRYDGWFLVMMQAAIIVILGLLKKSPWKKIEGSVVIFCTFAFFGIFLWLLWGQLILGNAFYFTQSEFSARTQQQAWLAKGQLPAYKDIWLSFLYYFTTSMSNSGFLLFFLSIVGFFRFAFKRENRIERLMIGGLMVAPFLFYVITLYVGQSVIFIPHITPKDFEWRLFNVRYGVMMIPVVAVFVGYLFFKVQRLGKLMIISLFCLQYFFYGVGYSKAISYIDGIQGLSHAKKPDAEQWMYHNYDGGLVLFDDYARTVSVVRSGIPMKKIIYIGTKPYWEESLVTPEKHARWIVLQKSDAIWNAMLEKPEIEARLYAHFDKVYTSPDILVFKRRD